MDNQLKKSNSYCLKRLLGRGQLDYIKQINFKFWPVLLPTNITQYILKFVNVVSCKNCCYFGALKYSPQFNKLLVVFYYYYYNVKLLAVFCYTYYGATSSILLYILQNYWQYFAIYSVELLAVFCYKNCVATSSILLYLDSDLFLLYSGATSNNLVQILMSYQQCFAILYCGDTGSALLYILQSY